MYLGMIGIVYYFEPVFWYFWTQVNFPILFAIKETKESKISKIFSVIFG